MIFVTGGTGFIGSNIVAALNDRGRSDIVILDSLGCDSKWRNIAKRRFHDIITPDRIDAFLKDAPRADAVFHMGAISSTTASDGDEILRTNIQLSASLWNWCAARRTPLIYASSAATYGDGSAGFSDDSSQKALAQLRPLNLYGWSKHAFDRWALDRAAAGVAPPQWAGMKFFNVYGPNEAHKGDMQSLVAKNTAAVAAGETISLFKSHRDDYQDGQQLRDFVYVADCVAVMMWLFDHPDVSGLFNLGTGKARSFLDLTLAIGGALGKNVDVRYVDMPIAIRDRYQYFTQAQMEKLRDAGCDVKFHTLEEGVADYVLNYLTQPDPYR
ncbi:ADP-glyceromanno-heptose 6-epimerase [Methylocella sp.]|uniref:ADP-glyceromanno-heptose 6-epimerase n=1 Tax=Methylocella sp. TaxID=1978226 RepID=UPI0037842D33